MATGTCPLQASGVPTGGDYRVGSAVVIAYAKEPAIGKGLPRLR